MRPALSRLTAEAARRGYGCALRTLSTGSVYAELTARGEIVAVGMALLPEDALDQALVRALPTAERRLEESRRAEREIQAELRRGRIECPACRGDQNLTTWCQDGVERDGTCDTCNGEGSFSEFTCRECGDPTTAPACFCGDATWSLCAECAIEPGLHSTNCARAADAEALRDVLALFCPQSLASMAHAHGWMLGDADPWGRSLAWFNDEGRHIADADDWCALADALESRGSLPHLVERAIPIRTAAKVAAAAVHMESPAATFEEPAREVLTGTAPAPASELR